MWVQDKQRGKSVTKPWKARRRDSVCTPNCCRLTFSSVKDATIAMRRVITGSLRSKLSRSKSFSINTIYSFHSNRSLQNPILTFPRPEFHFIDTQNSGPVHYQPNLFHRAIQTSLAHSSQLPSSWSEDLRLEESLDTACTTEELMTTFKAFEASLSEDDRRVGLACLKVADHLHSKTYGNLEEALSLTIRALEILGKKDEGSLPLVKALRLVGSISYKMKRFDESLESFETAYQILCSLEEEGFGAEDFDSEKIAIQLELANTKIAAGQMWDALSNLQRSLELRMLVLVSDSLELGAACKDVAEAYARVLEFGKALPLCLKALEIFEAKLGNNCEEVVQIRQLLGDIHVGLGENEDALAQKELCRGILQSFNLEAELVDVEIEVADIQIALGRTGEAMSTLKGVIQKTRKESETQAFAFVSMAKALFQQERFGDSKGFLDMSCDILNKMESTSSEKVTEALLEISLMYEMMSEFEIAISLMKRTVALIEKNTQERHLMGSIYARMGWLLLLTGRVHHAVPFLESAIMKLKNALGPQHFGLGFAYKHLGQAYLEVGKAQSAIQMLLLAKDIIEASFGTCHEDSIDTCQYIANAYGVMGSYDHAMEFQQEVVDRWGTHGPNTRDELREAFRLLQQLKKKAQGSSSAVFPANCLPQHLQK